MTQSDRLLTETVGRLLRETCTPEAMELAEATGWCSSAWAGLSGAGFTHVGLAEEAGGSGGTLADAAAVVRAVGHYAAPIPIAETALLGGWLLAQAGLELPKGPVTVAPTALPIDQGRIVGTARIAWAERSEAIAVLVERGGRLHVSRINPSDVEISAGSNMAGEPRETVRFDIPFDRTTHAPAPAGVDVDALRIRGALSRVLLMAGATEAMSQITLDYAYTRRQFGRPIAQFQAVQVHLVGLAQCAVQLSTAADLAVRALGRGKGTLEVAAAKIVADDAAEAGTRAAHQAHGAIGMTREYPLHLLTRRLWAWRHEYGTSRQWSRRLGQLAMNTGPDGLFPLIAGG